MHPQTVIEHFGTWNAAKRAAGLVPRRFATREELLGVLRRLGDELGRTPTARDLDERRGRVPSKSLYWHTFGSLANALREAGFDVAVGEERLERAVAQGAELARELGHLPKFGDWADGVPRGAGPGAMLTEWQVYRMFESRRGRVGDVPVPRPRAAGRGGSGRRLATDRCQAASAAAAIVASRLRQNSRSSGARTAGSRFCSTNCRGAEPLAAARPRRREGDARALARAPACAA